MEKYKIKLEIFEGPLDLLMHLLEKDQVDIYDIPITKITEQYLAYLKTLEEFNVDIASEFLVMAATLLQIKSRMLLPKPTKCSENVEDEIDPRQELVNRLLEYRKFKQMAAILDDRFSARNLVYFRQAQQIIAQVPLPEGLGLDDLLKAFAALWESSNHELAIVDREEFSIHDKMIHLIKLLHINNGRLEFKKAIFRTGGMRSELIATFLALLELIKMKRIIVQQENKDSAIFLILQEGGDMPDVLCTS